MNRSILALSFSACIFAAFLTLPCFANSPALPKIQIAPDGRTFETGGQAFQPLGMTYYRPGTGWAPQVWKQFSPEATRDDFARMKELGVNCVRVFLSFGSFLMDRRTVTPEGLAKFDQFLEMAEAAGIYVHPTGPDHWEGTPDWARQDRIADETVLEALEFFWTQLASRYRGRHVIFAYDLLNEPTVPWDSPTLRRKWNQWLEKKYGSATNVAHAWNNPDRPLEFSKIPAPGAKDSAHSAELLDYQLFREAIADEWTGRQVKAIKAADPDALATVGLIQWSVPSLLPQISHYSGFRPDRQARFLDFIEIHFYPLDHGFYHYESDESEARNLAYLEGVVREAAKPGKPVVVAEFGWYGGGSLTIDQGGHPSATEDQQARWCGKVIETTRGLAVGWLNWGLYDQPEARDVSQLTGLLTADGRLKSWGQAFKNLNRQGPFAFPVDAQKAAPAMDWNACLTSSQAGTSFRDGYYRAYKTRPK